MVQEGQPPVRGLLGPLLDVVSPHFQERSEPACYSQRAEGVENTTGEERVKELSLNKRRVKADMAMISKHTKSHSKENRNTIYFFSCLL